MEEENIIHYDKEFVRLRDKYAHEVAKDWAKDEMLKKDVAKMGQEAHVEFLKNEVEKIDAEIVHHKKTMDGITEDKDKWFAEMIEESYIAPLQKKRAKLKREEALWSSPIANLKPVDGSLTEQEIDSARSADSCDFVDTIRFDGQKHWARCPFHADGQEKTPSFCCYPDSKGFYCFGCGEGGDTITLVQKLHNMDFRQAVQFILSGGKKEA